MLEFSTPAATALDSRGGECAYAQMKELQETGPAVRSSSLKACGPGRSPAATSLSNS